MDLDGHGMMQHFTVKNCMQASAQESLIGLARKKLGMFTIL